MFKKVFSTGEKVLIPYLTAGVPSLDDSYELACAMIESGAKILELGVPFSDPSADGVVLQRASEVALAQGVTLKKVLDLSRRISSRHPQVPIVLFTYLNPLLAFGLDDYVRLARDSGISATLTVDLPPEEAEDYIRLHREQGLEMVFLVAPTTSIERLRVIQELSTPFVYYVSRTGVTGERVSLSETLELEVTGLRKNVASPLAIGFGISTPEQAARISKISDAVIIGSAYMRMILEEGNQEQRRRQVSEFTRSCVVAIE